MQEDECRSRPSRRCTGVRAPTSASEQRYSPGPGCNRPSTWSAAKSPIAFSTLIPRTLSPLIAQPAPRGSAHRSAVSLVARWSRPRHRASASGRSLLPSRRRGSTTAGHPRVQAPPHRQAAGHRAASGHRRPGRRPPGRRTSPRPSPRQGTCEVGWFGLSIGNTGHQ